MSHCQLCHLAEQTGAQKLTNQNVHEELMNLQTPKSSHSDVTHQLVMTPIKYLPTEWPTKAKIKIF